MPWSVRLSTLLAIPPVMCLFFVLDLRGRVQRWLEKR